MKRYHVPIPPRTTRLATKTDVSLRHETTIFDHHGKERTIVLWDTHPLGNRHQRRSRPVVHPIFTRKSVIDDWRLLPKPLRKMMKKRICSRRGKPFNSHTEYARKEKVDD